MLGKDDVVKIEAKRWFQKTYGNTYHSVYVEVNGNKIGYVPFTYGYGNQYIQTALEILQKAGLFPKTDNSMEDYLSFTKYLYIDNKNNVSIFCMDVDRKKDL